MNTEIVRIGTRKSKLAMWQAEHVAHLLTNGVIPSELIPIETKGDKVQNVALSKIGSKGVFTEELETMLRTGQIDIAVHSAKDLPSKLPEGFKVLSFCERESAPDVIIAEKEINFNDTALVLGTSSTRRIALLKHYYPQIRTVDVRGNLQTRIKKLKESTMDGLVLAYAGVKRMNYDNMIRHTFDSERFIPPVGQGAVAIEVHESLAAHKQLKIRELTNHTATEQMLLAERAFLRKMDGGCSIPVFGHAHMKSSKEMIISGGIASLDGKELIHHTVVGADPEKLGVSLATTILERGGDEILKNIRATLAV